MQDKLDAVLERLARMRSSGIWPNGQRYLWTDAFGVVLLVSLYEAFAESKYLEEAKQVVRDVDRVLGRPLGIRIGEAADRDGQYFHYLAMWMFALKRLGEHCPDYRTKAVELVKQVHPRFVVPGRGVIWKMEEDLSGPYPGYGWGALDSFHGYVVYRLLDAKALAREVADMQQLVSQSYPSLHVDQDLGLGMLLWMSHFFPEEPWGRTLRDRSLRTLDRMWIDPPGYFCREPNQRQMKFAFTNYGVSIGLQAVNAWPDRVDRLNRFFEHYRSGDHYDTDAITHVMGCCSLYPGRLIEAHPPD
jgi:hypothetical protein